MRFVSFSFFKEKREGSFEPLSLQKFKNSKAFITYPFVPAMEINSKL